MDFVHAFLISMLVSMAALPFLVYLGNRYAFIDQPSPRKVHTSPIPRIGGPAIALGFTFGILALGPEVFDRQVVALWLAGLVVLIVGLVDDRNELGYRSKFLAQFTAAIIVVYFGGIHIHAVTLPSELMLPYWISQPFSVLIIVALMNAVALSDGLDGLAGGIVFLCCLALCVLGYISLNIEAAVLAIAVAGAIFGFLRFNTHPASVFMGDSGSQFIGLMSAVLAIHVTQSIDSRISAALPLFLLALPVIDTVQVFIRRLRLGRSPFVADKNHLHHRLLELGLKHHQAVLTSYFIQCGFFLLAYFLRYESDLLVVTIFVLLAVLIISMLTIAESAVKVAATQTDDAMAEKKRPSIVARWRSIATVDARIVVSVLLIAYAGILAAQSGISNSQADTHDATMLWQVRALTIGLIVALAAALVTRKQRTSRVLITAVGYVTASVLAFLSSNAVWTSPLFQSLEHVTIAVLALVCILFLGLSNKNGAQLTTLDTLILFAALAVPSLPGLLADQSGVALLAIRLVIFFYAAEVLATFGKANRVMPLALILGLVLLHLQFIETSI